MSELSYPCHNGLTFKCEQFLKDARTLKFLNTIQDFDEESYDAAVNANQSPYIQATRYVAWLLGYREY